MLKPETYRTTARHSIRLPIALALLIVLIARGAEQQHDKSEEWVSLAGENDFVDYTVTHDIIEPHLHKITTTHISIYPAPWGCTFSQTEEVLGSKTSVSVTNVRYHGRLPIPQVADILNDLKNHDIASIPEPEAVDTKSAVQMVGKIGKAKFRNVYTLSTRNENTLDIHKRLIAVGELLKKHLKGTETVHVSESDFATARQVSMQELSAKPGEYDGMRISTTGYYESLHFEESYLYRARNSNDRIWIDKPSSFTTEARVAPPSNGLITVTGVFDSHTADKSCHGKLTRVTDRGHIEKAEDRPTAAARHR